MALPVNFMFGEISLYQNYFKFVCFSLEAESLQPGNTRVKSKSQKIILRCQQIYCLVNGIPGKGFGYKKICTFR